MSSNVSRGEQVAIEHARLSRRYELEAKYFVDNEQTEPFKILHGRDILSGTQLLPVFNFKTKKQSLTKEKKGESIEQELYYGPIAMAFCAGPVQKIYRIYYAEEIIYDTSGTGLNLTQNNYKAIPTSYGILNLSYGGELGGDFNSRVKTTKSEFDRRLPSIFKNSINVGDFNIPAGMQPYYTNVFHCYSDDFRLGNTLRYPDIRIEVEKTPDCLLRGIEWGENVNDYENDLNGDALPPLIIFDYLTNDSWGSACLGDDQIDIPSFAAACDICNIEGLRISPCIDSDVTIRDALSNILEYCDGALYLNDDGKIAIKLFRPITLTSDIDSITKSDMVDEPEIEWKNETFGVTKISFNDRDNLYEATSEVFDSPNYQATNGQLDIKELNMPHIKQRSVASNIAQRIGCAGSVPGCEIELHIANNLGENNLKKWHVGDVFKLTYEPYNLSESLFRISEINEGSSKKPDITIVAVNFVNESWAINNLSSSTLVPSEVTAAMSSTLGYLKPRILPVEESDIRGEYKTLLFVERCNYPPITRYTVDITGYDSRVDDANPEWADSEFNGEMTIIETTKKYNYFQIPFVIDSVDISASNAIVAISSTTEISLESKNQIIELYNQNKDIHITFAAEIIKTYTGGSFTKLIPITVLLKTDLDNALDFEEDQETSNYKMTAKGVIIKPIANKTNSIIINSVRANGYIYEKDNVAVIESSYLPSWPYSGEKVFKTIGLRGSRQEQHPGECYYCGVQLNQEEESSVSSNIYTRTGSGEEGDPYVYNELSWGALVSISGGQIIISNTSPTSEDAVSAAATAIYIDTSTGNTYHKDSNDFVFSHTIYIAHESLSVGTTAGTVAAGNHLHDERYQKAGYYVALDHSGTFEHVSDSNGLVDVTISSLTPITITLPAADGAENGDMITIVCEIDAGVELHSITLAASEGETFLCGDSSIESGVGTVAKLICKTKNETKYWHVITLPKI